MATYAINDWASDFLVKYYKKYNTKIKTAYLPTSTVAHIDWVELAAAKNKLTEGAHYFLAFQPLENFVDMLKEFSVFKKWQQTNMALVFIFENELAVWQANKLISGYTFKDSVIIKSIEELEMSWIAATYAITFNGTYFDKAILLNPNQPNFYIKRATAYGFVAMFSDDKNQDFFKNLASLKTKVIQDLTKK